jgi:hypothetical protein
MVTQINERGKIFTQVINKKPAEVIIQTQTHKISGTIYLAPENRMIDELNSNGQFLAVTNANILSQDDIKLYESEFLSVNLNQIIWILPVAEINQE